MISPPNKRHPLHHRKKWYNAYKALERLPLAEQPALARQLLCNPELVATNMLCFVHVFAKTFDTEAFAGMLRGFETERVKSPFGNPNTMRAVRSLKGYLSGSPSSATLFTKEVSEYLCAMESSMLGIWSEQVLLWGVGVQDFAMVNNTLNALASKGSVAGALKNVFTMCSKKSDLVFIDTWAQQHPLVMQELERFAELAGMSSEFPSLVAQREKQNITAELNIPSATSKPKVM